MSAMRFAPRFHRILENGSVVGAFSEFGSPQRLQFRFLQVDFPRSLATH